jgi:hypothetical protein
MLDRFILCWNPTESQPLTSGRFEVLEDSVGHGTVQEVGINAEEELFLERKYTWVMEMEPALRGALIVNFFVYGRSLSVFICLGFSRLCWSFTPYSPLVGRFTERISRSRGAMSPAGLANTKEVLQTMPVLTPG